MSLKGDVAYPDMVKSIRSAQLFKKICGFTLGAGVLISAASAQQVTIAKTPSQPRPNDFPSVRGYDPGYPIPYDPNNPYLALAYVNDQFDGVWTDIDGGLLDIRKYFSRAPQAEDYTDPNRPNPTPNTPHLTAAAAETFRKMRVMILQGNNPGQANGWCFITHAPSLTYWNQFLFTPDSFDASIPGGGGSISVHVYMDGRSHPANPIPSETGHQIAHWEGDTLVIDGVGFVADRDFEIGLLNSDQQHVITRYRRIQPDILEATYTVDDPKVFTEPWTFKRRFRRTSMEVNMLRDLAHCLGNANRPIDESGGNQLTSPDGTPLSKVPVD